jgi:hypothetical protein
VYETVRIHSAGGSLIVTTVAALTGASLVEASVTRVLQAVAA